MVKSDAILLKRGAYDPTTNVGDTISSDAISSGTIEGVIENLNNNSTNNVNASEHPQSVVPGQ